MSTDTPPSDYVQPGETVMVVLESGRLGDEAAEYWRAPVAKINRTTFTVQGITTVTGAGKWRPVQFRNQSERDRRHSAAGAGRYYVIQDGTPQAEEIIRRRTLWAARRRVDQAAAAWTKVERHRCDPYSERRPTPEAVDAALVELIEAAAQARKTLGIPGDDGTTVSVEDDPRTTSTEALS